MDTFGAQLGSPPLVALAITSRYHYYRFPTQMDPFVICTNDNSVASSKRVVINDLIASQSRAPKWMLIFLLLIPIGALHCQHPDMLAPS